jgi:uncharacterized membrane protein
MNNILLEPLLYLAAICSFSSYTFVRYSLVKTFNILFIIAAVIAEIAVVYCYYGLLKNNDSSIIVFPLIKILSVLIVFFYGFFIFGDKLTVKNIMGIIFSIVAIYLLS